MSDSREDAAKREAAAKRAAARRGDAPAGGMSDDERERRIAASIGAQVVLDPSSDVALAARGALGRTMTENVVARDEALVARVGGPEALVQPEAPPVVRDPVVDPESDAALAARGVKPSDSKSASDPSG